MDGSTVIRVITTTSSKEEAEGIAQELVRRRLAACVQVSGPVSSIYPWKGTIEKDQEWKLSIKTLWSMFHELRAALLELHSYEVPQILAIPVEGVYGPYVDWMKEWIEGSNDNN